MDISVIIPTHNRAQVLPRALESVINQRLQPSEIILVDDGSSDATPRLIRERYPDCIYLQQPNQGVSHARNRGITQSRGEWIALLDSDDEWLPDKLAAQAEQLGREPNRLVCHTEEIWVRNGVRVNAMKKHAKGGGYIFRECLPLCVISPSSVLIHRSIFEEVGLFDEDLPACEDYDLWLRICARHPVAFVEQPQIIKYGGHQDQLSRMHWGMDRFRVRALQKIIESGEVNGEDRNAAIAMLRRKSEILAQGARKRGNREAAANYLALGDSYDGP